MSQVWIFYFSISEIFFSRSEQQMRLWDCEYTHAQWFAPLLFACNLATIEGHLTFSKFSIHPITSFEVVFFAFGVDERHLSVYTCTFKFVGCSDPEIYYIGSESPVALAAVRSKAVVLLLFRWLLLPLWDSVIVRYVLLYVILCLSSWMRRESWLLCLVCLPGVSWLLSGSSSRCHGFVCSWWLWYFLIILTYYFYIDLLHIKMK